MFYYLKPNSDNSKTGNIAVSYTGRESCPDSCALKGGGCYAEGFRVAGHWNKVSTGERGIDWEAFVSAVGALPRGSLFRHNIGGDLPGENEAIDEGKLEEMASVIRRRRLVAWTYTHKPAFRALRQPQGFAVNISTETLADADRAARTGHPVVVVLPAEYENRKAASTPNGRLVVVCPAARADLAKAGITCQSCGNGSPLCARADREYIIGFPAHGTKKKAVSKIAAIPTLNLE